MNFSKISQSIKMSIKSIAGNKGRSALTMLGIVIGVASVILLTGIGGGATKAITDALSEMGTKLITVTVNSRNSSRSIAEADIAEFVEDNPELVSTYSPYISGNTQVKYGNNNFSTTLDGIDANYQEVQNVDLSAGRFFNESDIERRANIAIVGTYIQAELFGGMNPVGETIRLNGKQFTVVGVYEEKGDSTEYSADNKVTIPYTTAMRFLKNKRISTYYLLAASETVVEQAVEETQRFIQKELGSEYGFRVSSVSEMLDTMNEMTGTMTAMLAGIAAISLVVGGIGIMNIMTVSVSERTREIGIRKAIGARTTDILLQFLIESIILSGMGGIVGIGVGLGLGALVAKVAAMEVVMQTNMVLLSFGFSIFIGIFFGIMPARKAAKLHPIDALRSE